MDIASDDTEWFYTRGIFESSLDQIVQHNTRDTGVFESLRHSRSGRILVISITVVTQASRIFYFIESIGIIQ